MRRAVPAVFALVASLSVAATSGGVEWSQFGGDAGHTFAQPDETTISVASVPSLTRVWRTDAVSPTLGEIAGIAVAAGTVYVVPFGRVLPDDTPLTRLYAFDLEAGALRWSTRLPGYTRWTPAIEGGSVLVAIEGPQLPLGVVAVDATTGQRRWVRRLDCTHCSPTRGETWPIVAEDGVAIAAMGGAFVGDRYHAYGQMWAFDVTDGTELWTRETRLPGLPVILDGAVIVSEESVQMNTDESILARELRTGQQRWLRTRRVRWTVSLSGSGVEVFAATGYRLMSLATGDGSVNWREPMGNVVGAPTVGPGLLYVDGYRSSDFRSSGFAALDRATGELVWARHPEGLGYTYLAGTMLANGVLFVSGRHEYGDRLARPMPYDRTWALRASNGRTICALPRHLWGFEFFNVAIADGYVLKSMGTLLEAFTVPSPPAS